MSRSRRPATFKQGDVTRALRATVAAGIEIRRVEIGADGKIVVVTGAPEPSEATNPWLAELEKIKQ
jgi:hypothetical protein